MRLPNENCEVEDDDIIMLEAQPKLPQELSKSRMEKLKADFKNGNIRLKPHDDEIVRVWLGRITILMHKDLFAVSSTVFRELLEDSLSARGAATCSVSVQLQGEPEVFKLVKHVSCMILRLLNCIFFSYVVFFYLFAIIIVH